MCILCCLFAYISVWPIRRNGAVCTIIQFEFYVIISYRLFRAEVKFDAWTPLKCLNFPLPPTYTTRSNDEAEFPLPNVY